MFNSEKKIRKNDINYYDDFNKFFWAWFELFLFSWSDPMSMIVFCCWYDAYYDYYIDFYYQYHYFCLKRAIWTKHEKYYHNFYLRLYSPYNSQVDTAPMNVLLNGLGVETTNTLAVYSVSGSRSLKVTAHLVRSSEQSAAFTEMFISGSPVEAFFS